MQGQRLECVAPHHTAHALAVGHWEGPSLMMIIIVLRESLTRQIVGVHVVRSS
jgi:hypothetical protein